MHQLSVAPTIEIKTSGFALNNHIFKDLIRNISCMDESLKVRFWEVDFLRGLAIILMVLFHSVYDLDYFDVYDIDLSSGVWFYLARFTTSLFLLLVGVSLFLSYSRTRLLGEEDRFRFRLLKRSIWILILAMGITLVTYFSIGKGFIVFGVLHFIGISLLLAYPFLRLQWQNFVIGLFFILAGLYLQTVNVEFPWLIWLGLAPQDFSSLDYVPIFPWFGVVLMGMGLGDLLYGATIAGSLCRISPIRLL